MANCVILPGSGDHKFLNPKSWDCKSGSGIEITSQNNTDIMFCFIDLIFMHGKTAFLLVTYLSLVRL